MSVLCLECRICLCSDEDMKCHFQGSTQSLLVLNQVSATWDHTVTGSCWKKGVMTCATFGQSKVREGKWILEYLATVVQSFGV